MSEHCFYWKFSRDGDYSTTYSALIMDVPENNIKRKDGKIIWLASFNTIAKLLLLLQDIEIFNKLNGEKSAGLKKPSYVNAVKACGFKPPEDFPEKRQDIVFGKAVMGKHNGAPLDWGYFEDNSKETILVDVTAFEPALHINGKTGIAKNTNRDLLECYRKHKKFSENSFYWDLMPRHIHMSMLFSELERNNKSEANNFVQKELGWATI